MKGRTREKDGTAQCLGFISQTGKITEIGGSRTKLQIQKENKEKIKKKFGGVLRAAGGMLKRNSSMKTARLK